MFVRLAIWPSILAMQKIQCWTLHTNFSTKLFHTRHAFKGIIDFYHFYTTFTDLDLAWDHKVSTRQNLLTSFSCTLFNWSGGMVLKQFKLNIPLLIWMRLPCTYCFTDCVKNFNVGMHSDIYQWIWFKLGMMIDTIVLYILILVYLTLTFIQGHWSVRKQQLLSQLCHKVFIWFEWNSVFCWDLFMH